jgi:Protein of unknown function (DUF4012)
MSNEPRPPGSGRRDSESDDSKKVTEQSGSDSASEAGEDSLGLWRSDEGDSAGPRHAPVETEHSQSEKPRDEVEAPISESLGDMWRVEEGEHTLPFNASKRPKPSPSTPIARPSPPPKPDVVQKSPRPETRSTKPVELRTSPIVPKRANDSAGSRPAGRTFKRVLLLLVVLFIGDAGWVAYGTYSSLRSVRSDLQTARDELEKGEIELARDHLESALDGAQSAGTLQKHPAFWPASLTPDGESVAHLTAASELLARSGLKATDAAESLGLGNDNPGEAVYRQGRLNFDVVDTGDRAAETISSLLDQAQAELDDSPQPIFKPVEEALTTARTELADARGSVENGRLLFSLLPGLFGEDEPRQFLLAFQALGEARGTGGFIGFYGVLRAENGKLDLGRVASVKELPWVRPGNPPVEAPADWFSNNYGSQNALRQVQQVNLSPNFPVVAETLLRMYEQTVGDPLDGVVAMDPVALADMLAGVGEIRGPGLDEDVTSENAEEIIMYDSYLEFSDPEQNRFLGGLLRDFWSKASSSSIDAPALASGLGDAIATQHFKIYSREDNEQETLAMLNAHGGYTTAGENVQLIFHNNYGRNKIDYLLKREIDTRIKLHENGDARVTTSVTLVNEAADGPPSLFLGEFRGNNAPGLNEMYLNFLLPKAAQVHSFRPSADSPTRLPLIFSDTGRPVVWDYIEVDPGETRTVTTSYVLVDAARLFDNRAEFEFTMFPQATARPDEYSIRITPPKGYLLGAGGEADDEVFTQEGVLERPISLDLDVNPEP